MTGPHLTWALGGEARIVSITADTVTLESTTPSPPGSRIEGGLVAGSKRTVRFKVHASRREASGLFRIEGRPLDLTKDAREELRRLATAPGHSLEPVGGDDSVSRVRAERGGG